MNSVTRQAAAHAAYIAAQLDPAEVRRSALGCIAAGYSPGLLRAAAARRLAGMETVWLAWASEIEAVTGQTPRDARETDQALGGAQ